MAGGETHLPYHETSSTTENHHLRKGMVVFCWDIFCMLKSRVVRVGASSFQLLAFRKALQPTA